MDLDEKLLGERYPGDRLERKWILKSLEGMLERNGEDWVKENAQFLLREARYLVDEGML